MKLNSQSELNVEQQTLALSWSKMAAGSAFPVRKPKKQVYGKVSAKSNWNVASFFDEDELSASNSGQIARRTPLRLEPSVVDKTSSMKTEGAKSGRMRPPKHHDTFDVPSSDDERTEFATIGSTFGFKVKNTLVDDSNTSCTQLAPWERSKVQSDRKVSPRTRRQAPASPEAQLKQDLERATLSPERNHDASFLPHGESHSQCGVGNEASPARKLNPNAASAAARLAARRKVDSQLPCKRAALAIDEEEGTTRKRVRDSHSSQRLDDDVHTLVGTTCEMHQEDHRIADEPSNVYDLPVSSEDDLSNSRMAPKPIKKTKKQGQVVTYASKKRITKKGTSAPARLAEMISIDTDTTNPPSRSASSTRRSTPQKIPSTPPSATANSPGTDVKANVHLTPKQSQLWSQLLPGSTVNPSPSALALKDLRISGDRRSQAASASRSLAKSKSDLPTRRTRLVDRLKASAPSSENEMSDNERIEIDSASAQQHGNRVPQKPAALERKPSQISQPQSQTGAASGPKITYASTRSFLPEDSLQADFLAELDSPAPLQQSNHVPGSKARLSSKKSPFDVDAVEDEGGSQSGIRTIHELRASGRTISGMYEIQELLGEIQNHSISQRSRRRSAFIELANKLSDKAFATRFVEQSMEAEIALECGAVSDDISDFLLAAAIALILASEPPEHTVRTFQDQGVLHWLSKLLDKDSDVRFIVKDRRNNMSKSAQGSLTAFANTLRKLPVLWHEKESKQVTSRLVALRALDLLIGKVRHMGDRSELLQLDKIQLVLPAKTQDLENPDHLETTLAISVLDSLSTTPASLKWPSSSIETISALLPLLSIESSTQRHTLFLILRLCLNLTNDSHRNCEILAEKPGAVDSLLSTIKQGFDSLGAVIDNEKRALALDLLVLALGIIINLAEKSETAREHAIRDEDMLLSFLAIFERGQQNMLDAESVEESVSNVAFGYLAVLLSNLCQNDKAKSFIASKLPGKNLGMLVGAVEEFVLHHQKVDQMNFEGEEGAAVWGAFTEKLKAVLGRLQGST